MHVICCFTELHPAAEAALARYAPQRVMVPLDPGDEHAYWKALAQWWDRPHGSDLLVIEQDIVIGPQTVRGMEACRGTSDWCAAPYPVYEGHAGLNERALGCTRFSARLQAAVPAESFRAPWPHVADKFIALFDPLHPHRHREVGHRKAAP